MTLVVTGGAGQEADRKQLVMDGIIVPEMPALPESRFESIANLYRETRSGKLVTDVKGKVYLNCSSMPQEQLNLLQEAARNWSTWLGITATEFFIAAIAVPSPEMPAAAFVETLEVEPAPAIDAPEVEAAVVAPEAEAVSALPETEEETSPVESQADAVVNAEIAAAPINSSASTPSPTRN